MPFLLPVAETSNQEDGSLIPSVRIIVQRPAQKFRIINAVVRAHPGLVCGLLRKIPSIRLVRRRPFGIEDAHALLLSWARRGRGQLCRTYRCNPVSRLATADTAAFGTSLSRQSKAAELMLGYAFNWLRYKGVATARATHAKPQRRTYHEEANRTLSKMVSINLPKAAIWRNGLSRAFPSDFPISPILNQPSGSAPRWLIVKPQRATFSIRLARVSYGNTKKGAYICQKDADQAGFHVAKGETAATPSTTKP